MAARLRRREDDDGPARPAYPPLPHSRNRKRQLPRFSENSSAKTGQTRKGESTELDERLTPKTIIKPGQFSMEIPGQISAAAERDLSLVISRLEDFSARVTEGLDALDERGRQEIVRALVRRIEIDDPGIEVIFRVPSLDGPAGPPTLTKTNASWHHCSGVRRAHVRLDDPLALPRARRRRAHRLFRSHDPRRSRKRPAQANSSRISVFKRTSGLPPKAIGRICHFHYHLTYEEVFSCRHATLS